MSPRIGRQEWACPTGADCTTGPGLDWTSDDCPAGLDMPSVSAGH